MLEYNISLYRKTVLVTGAAGFIGSNLVKRLFHEFNGIKIVGIDSVTDYYDVNIKYARLEEIEALDKDWTFVKASIADKDIVNDLFSKYHFSVVVNLAAQAGVRYSITNPDAYIESNLIGFYNILEACRHNEVEHLVYASSSSVYGSNKKVPYSTDDKVDNPVSLYAATKKSNELMAHAYSKLYNIPSTGLRFFTVYGPAGRPDMAYFGFTNKLVKGRSSRYSTTVTANVILPMWMISWREYYVSCSTLLRSRLEKTVCLCLRTRSITSATVILRTCSSSWISSSRSCSVQEFSRRTTTSILTRNSFQCSRAMFR